MKNIQVGEMYWLFFSQVITLTERLLNNSKTSGSQNEY